MKLIQNDFELVEKLQGGDSRAFDLIYEKYSVKLYLFGLKYLKSKEDAEELVQTVFLKIWENRKTLNRDLSLKTYLFTITYNDICKIFRKRMYLQKFIESSEGITYFSSETEERIDYKSSLDRVLQIINKLPEKQKTIFLKSRGEGKSTREIAEEVGLSAGTIDNYISGSIKFIKARMNREELSVIIILSLFFSDLF